MEASLTEAFKALGNPHRFAIMKRLLEQSLSCSAVDRPEECELDPTCCGFSALAEELDIGKATVSHHLKELRWAGLIERVQEGRRVFVRANPKSSDSFSTRGDMPNEADQELKNHVAAGGFKGDDTKSGCTLPV